MLNIIKEKLDLSPDLKKKIDWAKNYTSTSITLEKGHLIRLEPSNLAYVDPPKLINKSEINKAISSINREMDEAAKDFYQTKKDDWIIVVLLNYHSLS